MKKLILLFLLPSLLFIGCDKSTEDIKPDDKKEEQKEEEKEVILGCTDPESLNYNANATESDGTCKYAEEKNTLAVVDVSATWCGPCGAVGIPAFGLIYDAYHEDAVLINCQTNRSDLANSTSLALSNYVFQTSSIPKFFANKAAFGVYTPLEANVQYVKQQMDEFAAKPVVAGLYGEYSTSGTNDFSAKIWTKFYQETNDIYKLGVYIMENGVKNYQASIGANHIHDHIVRDALSGNLGTSYSKKDFADGEIVISDFNKTTNGILDINNCYVIAIMYKGSGSNLEIVNSLTLEKAPE